MTKSLEVVAKVKYFQVPALDLRTVNGNQLHGNLASVSVSAGVAWKL